MSIKITQYDFKILTELKTLVKDLERNIQISEKKSASYIFYSAIDDENTEDINEEIKQLCQSICKIMNIFIKYNNDEFEAGLKYLKKLWMSSDSYSVISFNRESVMLGGKIQIEDTNMILSYKNYGNDFRRIQELRFIKVV